ncbi:hypothetical protein E2320_019659, partial [Naja naja]
MGKLLWMLNIMYRRTTKLTHTQTEQKLRTTFGFSTSKNAQVADLANPTKAKRKEPLSVRAKTQVTINIVFEEALKESPSL